MSPIRAEFYRWHEDLRGRDNMDYRDRILYHLSRMGAIHPQINQFSGVFEPEEVVVSDERDTWVKLGYGIRIYEGDERTTVDAHYSRKSHKCFLTVPGDTAIARIPNKGMFATVTLFERGGPFDSGEERGDFGEVFFTPF